MGMAQNKKQEEVSPQAVENPTSIDLYSEHLTSLGDIYKAAEDELAEKQKKYESIRAKANEAKAQGFSVLGSLLEEQKPVYDEQKERTLRKRAIVQSLGDILTAATKGAIAYGRRGMGYVPKSVEGGAFSSLAEISKMQEEYQRRNEAWKALDLNYRRQQAEAEIAAQDALASAAENDVVDATKALEARGKELREAYRKGLDIAARGEENERRRVATAEEKAKDRAARAAEGVLNRQNRLDAAAVSRDAKTQKEEEDYIKLAILDIIAPYSRSHTRSGSRTNNYGRVIPFTETYEQPITADAYNANERKLRLAEYDNNKLAQSAYYLYSQYEGMTPERAVREAKEQLEKENK